MVCSDCEKKLSKVIVPDKWKDGARNAVEGVGRKIGENKLLSSKSRASPYDRKCLNCKSKISQANATYCQSCAYKKGLCAMCGKQIINTTLYKQTTK